MYVPYQRSFLTSKLRNRHERSSVQNSIQHIPVISLVTYTFEKVTFLYVHNTLLTMNSDYGIKKVLTNGTYQSKYFIYLVWRISDTSIVHQNTYCVCTL